MDEPTNKPEPSKKEWDDKKYIELYHLTDIVDDDNMLSNILSSLRFRNELADLYNKGIGHGELKQNWLSNILVIDSSVIEGILFAAMAKIESNCKRVNCKKILKCSFFSGKRLTFHLSKKLYLYHFD